LVTLKCELLDTTKGFQRTESDIRSAENPVLSLLKTVSAYPVNVGASFSLALPYPPKTYARPNHQNAQRTESLSRG